MMNFFQETWDRASPAMMFMRPSRKGFGDYGRLKTTSTLREMHHNPHAGDLQTFAGSSRHTVATTLSLAMLD